jgi:hypothetical protein
MCVGSWNTSAGMSRRHILVVNDDVRLARSVAALLADNDYDVRVAF